MILRFDRSFGDSPVNLLRRCGYASIVSRRTGETSFSRRLSAQEYPRFHCYVREYTATSLVLTLHLDAKKPVYEGQTAHSGEYDGPVVEQEAERLRSLLGASA